MKNIFKSFTFLFSISFCASVCFGQALTMHDPSLMSLINQSSSGPPPTCNNTFISYTSNNSNTANDYTLGNVFNSGASPPTICSLGLECLHTGDSYTHTNYVCAGTYVAGVSFTVTSIVAEVKTLSLSGVPAFSSVSSSMTPVALSPNTYYVEVFTTGGGDTWNDNSTATVSIGTLTGSCYVNTAVVTVGTVFTFVSAGQSYGNMNFNYQ
jgi:hypothetical protein